MPVFTRVSLYNTHAVSEVVGGVLLLAIAVLAFSAIYSVIFPLPGVESEQHAKMIGYVDLDGTVKIEHIGGEPITSFRIDVKDINGTVLGSNSYEENWGIGVCKIPTSTKLLNESQKLHVTVYTVNSENGQELLFEGILQGNVPKSQTSGSSNSSDQPYLISSLLTDSTDEDLICFNKTSNGVTINASFSATSYIYNWIFNSEPFASMILPCDTDSSSTVKDYTGNNYHGMVHGASWSSQGINSGSYSFDGTTYISIPYCFKGSTINDVTIEFWVKTSNTSVTLLSYNSTRYGEITISNGLVKWTTTSNGNTRDIIGSTDISDNQWHHVTVTYTSDSGTAAIFVDGIIEESESVHAASDTLGSGSITSGYLGKGFNTQSTEYVTIFTDTFETDKGWSVQNSPYLSEGEWERGTPVDDERGDPPSDADGSGKCYITENEREKDIDGSYNNAGITWLISPSFDLSSYLEASFSCEVWYTNDYGYSPDNDYFYIDVSNDGGSTWTRVQTIGPTTPEPKQWYEHTFQIEEYIALTDNVKIRFEASDAGSGSVVEAGVDAIELTGLPTGGSDNLTGMIDDVRIYERLLSEEQIYQDYLCMKDGESDISVIVAEETTVGDTWYCVLTPNDQCQDASSISSNQLEITLYGGG
jgi:FlaG/FlaF family flagellin (archaellin)